MRVRWVFRLVYEWLRSLLVESCISCNVVLLVWLMILLVLMISRGVDSCFRRRGKLIEWFFVNFIIILCNDIYIRMMGFDYCKFMCMVNIFLENWFSIWLWKIG